LIKIDSTKLFFDKYKYKVDLNNALGFVFRNKNFALARKSIDEAILQSDTGNVKWGIGLRQIVVNSEDLADLQLLLSEFTRQKEKFTLRCESYHLGIYTNNFEWCKELDKKLNAVTTVHMPINDVDLPKGVIINDTINFAYKITLNGTSDPNLADFCIKNKDKIKIGNRVLSDIKRGYNLKGMYMYVKDQGTITLIRLFLKKDLMRIDKIVSSKDLDK
jgi:hypothetical protein|tara:strand:+ start:6918 stop:7571 length:654 start_codon:yes stop_codon:yes gene_type:complete